MTVFLVTLSHLPFDGRARRKDNVCLLMKKSRRVDTNIYSRKTLEKQKRSLRILKIRVRELFTHGEGISTPCVCHKGQQPLIKCAKHDFKIMYFPFLYFFIFWGRQGCCPCSYVSLGAMRNSDLRSSFKAEYLCVKLVFFMFLKDSF